MPAHTEGEYLSLGDTEGSLQERKDRRMKFSVFLCLIMEAGITVLRLLWIHS